MKGKSVRAGRHIIVDIPKRDDIILPHFFAVFDALFFTQCPCDRGLTFGHVVAGSAGDGTFTEFFEGQYPARKVKTGSPIFFLLFLHCFLYLCIGGYIEHF